MFGCKECGEVVKKWVGYCKFCKSYNSYDKIDEIFDSDEEVEYEISKFSEIDEIDKQRMILKSEILNRVFGGGITIGSINLIGGEPGVGKSTLVMEIARELSFSKKVLYASGEETISQVKMKNNSTRFKDDNLLIISTNSLNKTLELAEESGVLIIDSIQTMLWHNNKTSIGSVSQIKECTMEILKFCKKKQITVFIVGHITKNGEFAGPKILEHMVDTVLYFENTKKSFYKIIRVFKNRFGTNNEIAIFTIDESGFKIINPKSLMLSDEVTGAIVTTIEGSRIMIAEIQVLTTQTLFGNPKRAVNGIDQNKINIILAVIEKYAHIPTQNKDVFVKVIGGIKITDTSIDLGLTMAIISSILDIEIKEKVAFIGEIMLNGKIKSVDQIKLRVDELIKNGFETIYVPNKADINIKGAKIIKVDTINAVIKELK